VCKNVLLHFGKAEQTAVVRMFHSSLREGGYFITENTQSLPAGCDSLFERVASGAQIHRKVPAAVSRQAEAPEQSRNLVC
jgi:chemotaxis protein methyltransferase CheR